MSNRTVIIVVAIAVVLFGFIYLVDSDSMSTDELKDRDDRVFVKFKQDFVEAFSVKGSSGENVSLVRSGDAAAGEVEWFVKEPRELKADDAAVRSVLSALDFLLKGRVVKGADTTSDSKYGLDQPQLTGTFSMGGKTTVFKIGGSDVSGDKIYVAVEGRNEVYAVESDFLKSLDKGLADLRDKHLIEGTLSSATAATLKKSAVIALMRDDSNSSWKIEREGHKVLASGDQVAELLREMGSLRAESFVADGVKEADFSKYGFNSEAGTFTATLEDGKKIKVLFGKSCEDDTAMYATLAGSGTVACVSSKISTILDRPVPRFTETRLAVFRENDVEKITITRDGKSLVIEKNVDDDTWGTPGEDTSLDQSAVSSFLALLSETRADLINIGNEAVEALGEPTGTVEIALDSGMGKLPLQLFSRGEGTPTLARRGDEPAVLSMNSTAVLDSLEADILAFRDKVLKNGSSDDVVEFEITGPAAQTLVTTDGAWSLTKPLALKADGSLVRSLADKITSLKVVAFVSDKASVENGFSSPWAEVSAKLVGHTETEDGEEDRTKESKLTLQIGAVAGSDTRYAKFKEKSGVVFTVGDEILSLVSHPLVSRDLLQVSTEEIVKIEFSGKSGDMTAELDGDNWKSTTGDLDSVTLKRLLTDLGATRAVRSDAFLGGSGFEENTLTIKFYTKDDNEQESSTVLMFGSKGASVQENGYLARRKDVPVSFIYPARVVDELTAMVESKNIVAR